MKTFMAILATQKVLTLDYWKLASDLVPGDLVFDHHGNISKVTLVHKYRSEDCYEVMFNDYLSVAGDKHLTLPTETRIRRDLIHKYQGKRKFTAKFKYFTAEQLATMPLLNNRGRKNYSVPTTDPIKLPHQTLPVPPFLFGYWFFAHLYNDMMAPQAEYAEFVHSKFEEHGYKVSLHRKSTSGRVEFTTTPTIRSHLVPFVPTKIPNNYLWGSPEQRLELLSGIMHAKRRQYDEKTDKFTFSSRHRSVITQVQALAESLGCRTRVEHDTSINRFYLFIKTRLRLLVNQKSPPIKVHQSRRYVTQISKLPSQLCVHIETNSPQGTFLVEEGFIAVC